MYTLTVIRIYTTYIHTYTYSIINNIQYTYLILLYTLVHIHIILHRMVK